MSGSVQRVPSPARQEPVAVPPVSQEGQQSACKVAMVAKLFLGAICGGLITAGIAAAVIFSGVLPLLPACVGALVASKPLWVSLAIAAVPGALLGVGVSAVVTFKLKCNGKTAAAKEAPAVEAAAKEAAAKEAPAVEAAAKEAPAKEAPAKEAPAKEAPAVEAAAPGELPAGTATPEAAGAQV